MYEELPMKEAFNSVYERNVRQENDYIGDDGLLMCGNCHTPKQYRLKSMNNMIVPSSCKCSQEKSRLEDEEKKQIDDEASKRSKKKSSNIPQKFKDCTFDDVEVLPDNVAQFKMCKRYSHKFDSIRKNNQGLLLYGGVGNGKTLLSCCIANDLLEKGKSVYFISLVDAVEKFNNFDVNKEEIINRVKQTSLLIVDDLGAERSTDFAKEIVYNIINTRYEVAKPMIVTANLTIQQMQETTDLRCKRIYDRVFENCYPIRFDGSSYRLKKAANSFDEMSEILKGSDS